MRRRCAPLLTRCMRLQHDRAAHSRRGAAGSCRPVACGRFGFSCCFDTLLTGGASFDAFGAFHFVFELKLTETPPVSDSARSVPFMLAGGSVPNSISIQFVAV